MTTAPNIAQMNDWLTIIRSLVQAAEKTGVYFDGFEVEGRVRTELFKRRTLQGGCAYRVMRFAKALRDGGYTELSDSAYMLAKDMIPHENCPSPGWKTMCEDFGFTHEPVSANDY